MTVKSYVKKPVVIQAIQFDGTNATKIFEFMSDNASGVAGFIDPGTNELIIRTLEGDMKASVNDFIIKGVKGEFYPCKPDIFEQTYALAVNSNETP